MAIPDEILNKPARLTEDEYELMKQHTLIGERMLAAAPAMGGVARIVRSSHERWDGCGIPRPVGWRSDPARGADRGGLRLVRRHDDPAVVAAFADVLALQRA